ncbi:hypothetical protein FP74_gp238 [Bacillus phage CAM003]|uniref:Uncharacterized protein n=1 Tax=Bacillus phage CAM003 TaxID=1486657 RepID=A0A024B0M3_9CAUD|nr:hypothetical protein FP74_gp238 [Bacillus phage CAM003]AHZ09558.1 hypothetical protein [Bacillus phage CAM003]
MQEKFVILYHKRTTEKIRTGTGATGWETVFDGVKVVHESEPLSSCPTGEKLRMLTKKYKPIHTGIAKGIPMEYDFVTVEKRFYHAD